MSEEQKVDNRKLAGWKRAILIAVPFVLLGLAILFMVKGITAWGPDFTRNHGDAYLTLGLICTILLFVGIAMQFVWPKAINRGRRIVVVGLVFNIILAISGAIVIGVGYGLNATRYALYETRYNDMTKRVREGLTLDNKSKTVAPGVTVEQFIKDFSEFNDKYSGERAIQMRSVGLSKLESYTTSAFIKEHGYDSFAYQTSSNVTTSIEVFNLYMGDADLKTFATKYGFSTSEEYGLYGKDYKLEYAPEFYEAVWSEFVNYNASKTVPVHFDYVKDVEYYFTSDSTTSGKTTHYTWKSIGIYVLFDLNAKAARVAYVNQSASWYSSL